MDINKLQLTNLWDTRRHPLEENVLTSGRLMPRNAGQGRVAETVKLPLTHWSRTKVALRHIGKLIGRPSHQQVSVKVTRTLSANARAGTKHSNNT